MTSLTLVEALSLSPYLAISHLQTISALTSKNLPSPVAANSLTIQISNVQALSHLLHFILPITLLPSAVSTNGPQHISQPIQSLLHTLQASSSLPGILPIPPLQNYILPHLHTIQQPSLDDASTSLAQEASTDADELAELWNRLLPDHSVSSPDELADQLQFIKTSTRRAHESAAQLDSLTTSTRQTTLCTMHTTLRNALAAVEVDTSERASEPSSHHMYIHLLCARGRAVTAKLKLLRAEIAASMYTTETARALRVVAGEVKAKMRQVESDLANKMLRLNQYRALGTEFLDVIRGLEKVRQVLEHKVWARRELLA